MVATSSFLDSLSQAASKAMGREIQMKSTSGGGYSGGGGAATSAVQDQEGVKYFVKTAIVGGGGEHNMLRAEYEGVKALSDTNTIKVPTPIAFGTHMNNQAFVIFEYLEFCGGGSQYQLGQQLAKLHRHFSPNGKFGFHIDNTIGATPQPNTWTDNWIDFWDTHRLGHMLKLTNNVGLSNEKIEKLREKTKELLSHNPRPSLIHGDLWGGNKGFCKSSDGKVIPCIFDPAVYYGDREADIAMTYVFGGFSKDFYDGYQSEWALPEDHEKRRVVYELYHILNHDVLFGGGYASQARGMIEKILRS
jgi:fructosamine-3-kinase